MKGERGRKEKGKKGSRTKVKEKEKQKVREKRMDILYATFDHLDAAIVAWWYTLSSYCCIISA